MGKIKILDTFAGIGGFHLALEQSIGKDNTECIGFCEIDKYAKETYLKNFPGVKDLGDITKIDIENLPDFNLLTGGFPCQDVSVAGSRDLSKGRTILVEYLLKILEIKQPEYFVFENVRGILSNKFKDFFESIIERARKAGYYVDYQLLDTKKHGGLAQSRPRVYIVGRRMDGEKDGGFNFPDEIVLEKTLQEVINLEGVGEQYYYPEHKLARLIDFGAKNSFGGRIQKKDYHGAILASYGIGAGNGGAVVDNKGIRILTENEAEYLQGFPKDWTKGVSMRNRYKQIGNAVTVNVIKRLFDKLIKCKNI